METKKDKDCIIIMTMKQSLSFFLFVSSSWEASPLYFVNVDV